MPAEIVFDLLDPTLSLPEGFSPERAVSWLMRVADREKKKIKYIQYVFCDDQYLYDINQEYLKHDTLTDIITFPYHSDPIEAEIYISLDRVKENAITFSNGDLVAELNRVIVHGLLHMCGYDDHTNEDKAEMRALESFYLIELL